MSGFDGNGIFDLPDNWPGNPGDVIQSNHALEFSQVVKVGFQNVITRDGQNQPSNDLPMGGHRHTGVADAVVDSNYLSLKQFRNNSAIYANTTGADNAYILTLNPIIYAYVVGQEFIIKTNFTTTNNAPTININGLGVKNLKNATGDNLAVGAIRNNTIYKIFYDGTDFRVVTLPVPGTPLSAQSLILAQTGSSDTEFGIDYYRTGSTQRDAIDAILELATSTVQASQGYTGTGSQTVFTVAFYVLAAVDLQVKVNGSIVTNYTVQNVGRRNGEMTVTFASAPANGAIILFERINLTKYVLRKTIGLFSQHDKNVKLNYVDMTAEFTEFARGIRLPINPNATVNLTSDIADCNGVLRHGCHVNSNGTFASKGQRGVAGITKFGTGAYDITLVSSVPSYAHPTVTPITTVADITPTAIQQAVNVYRVYTKLARTDTFTDCQFDFGLFY